MKQHIAPVGGALILFGSFLFFSFSSSDNFFNKASHANLSEIQAGKLAETKGNAVVKNLGKQMLIDHIIAENDLTALAKKENLTLAMNPDSHDQLVLASLTKLSGNAFDSAYLSSELSDQKTAIALFTAEAANGTDPGAKAYAGQYLAKFKMHLQMFEGNGTPK
jgi:putative membrane protein